MKNRTVKKVERRMLVDKVCELQREICEHERFEGDLLVMLSKGEPQCVVVHNCNRDYTEWIWDKVRDLIKENKELAQKLKSYEEKQ
jgi:hypothetical protein